MISRGMRSKVPQLRANPQSFNRYAQNLNDGTLDRS
jgi:hypothetical protein